MTTTHTGALRNSGRRTGASAARRRSAAPRPRIHFSDARRVRHRVETQAETLNLRGARRHVLTAVLGLLCGWSRVTDDAIRLSQIVAAIADEGGRCYDLKTVGRALAGLAEAELITYVPARGRGAFARIDIHRRFTGDVATLERDQEGRVRAESVTFSEAPPSYKPKNYLPTLLRSANGLGPSRPSEVDVHPADVRRVLAEMPAVFKQLPRHLRWRLGREIRNRLAAGYEPGQILDVLRAPLPAETERPWRLALWRLSHNMTGAGPRLRPLQRQWDIQVAETRRRDRDADDQRWCDAVTSVTDPCTQRELLAALADRLDCEIHDERRGLAHAGRMAVRQFGDNVTQALRLWLGAWKPRPRSETVDSPEPVTASCSDTTCVACQQVPGVVREALPLRSAVCDDCWSALADPELLLTDTNDTREEIPA